MPSSATRCDQTMPPGRDFQRWRASGRWHGSGYRDKNRFADAATSHQTQSTKGHTIHDLRPQQ